MPIFKLNNKRLDKIKKSSFKLEKEIQNLTEDNLINIFNLQIVKSEFSLNGLRIDTLAYDNENNSFVIIEYKRDKNFSVVDQGYAYLSLMLNNKAEFILEYNENCDKNLKRTDIDWSQSKVIFISPSFSKYQQQAINFNDLPMELWEISKYENNLIQYNRLKSPESSESIKKISKKSNVVEKVSAEIKVYTEEDFLVKSSDDVNNLYFELKNQILAIDENIEFVPKKKYIAFKSQSNFVDMVPQKTKIKLWLNLPKGQLKDTNKMAKVMRKESGEKIGHHGNGDYQIRISPNDDIPYLLTLIKQSYEQNS